MKSIERGGKRERGEERSEVIAGKCMGNIPLTGIKICRELGFNGK